VWYVSPFLIAFQLLDQISNSIRDNWAKTLSPNKHIKIYIGAPASATAAGSGYLDVAGLANVIQQTRSQYSSFGGVMLWDVSQAYGTFLLIVQWILRLTGM
jgi:chitinase